MYIFLPPQAPHHLRNYSQENSTRRTINAQTYRHDEILPLLPLLNVTTGVAIHGFPGTVQDLMAINGEFFFQLPDTNILTEIDATATRFLNELGINLGAIPLQTKIRAIRQQWV